MQGKMRRHIRNGGGFTLIEVILSLAITAIVGVFLAAFLGPQIRVYETLTEQNSAKSACAGVLNALKEKIEYGRDFSLQGEQLSYTLVTKEGELFDQKIDGVNLAGGMFPNLIRSGKAFSVRFRIDEAVVRITVSVQDAKTGEEIYSLMQSVYCVNEELPG